MASAYDNMFEDISGEKRAAYFELLESGSLYFFRDWPNKLVPRVASGVYTIWEGSRLIYVGMSGRGLSADELEVHRGEGIRGKGLFTRLNSHASGRRSGDQFCVYVGDRLVLPNLSQSEIIAIASGLMSMDQLVKQFIRENLAYRYIETSDGKIAHSLEREIRRGCLPIGKPFLNPL